MTEEEARRLLEGGFAQPGDELGRTPYPSQTPFPAADLDCSGVGPSDFEIKISAIRAAIDFTRDGMRAADELIRCAALIETYLRGEKS